MDVFDLFMVHEDGYTNLLKYLYDNVESFKENLSKMIFEDNPRNLLFKTRFAYIHDQNAIEGTSVRKKSVPDIVIYNNNHFCIIEVKVFASEGDDQTLRYYEAKDEIMKSLGVNASIENQKYFFLSLDNDVNLSSHEFQTLSWINIGECLEDCEIKNDLMNLIVKQFKERISSINGNVITDKSNWINTVRGDKWSMASDLLKALTLNKKVYNSYGWASFKRASNEYSLSTFIMPFGEWEGYSLKDDIIDKNHPELYYSIHNEFEYNPDNNNLSFRLDYELNPYYSKKEIEDIKNVDVKSFIQLCSERRREIAQKCKDSWNRYYCGNLKGCNYKDLRYNGHITDNLLVLISGKLEIKSGMTVGDVNCLINPFLEETARFVNEVMLPEIRNGL